MLRPPDTLVLRAIRALEGASAPPQILDEAAAAVTARVRRAGRWQRGRFRFHLEQCLVHDVELAAATARMGRGVSGLAIVRRPGSSIDEALIRAALPPTALPPETVVGVGADGWVIVEQGAVVDQGEIHPGAEPLVLQMARSLLMQAPFPAAGVGLVDAAAAVVRAVTPDMGEWDRACLQVALERRLRIDWILISGSEGEVSRADVPGVVEAGSISHAARSIGLDARRPHCRPHSLVLRADGWTLRVDGVVVAGRPVPASPVLDHDHSL